MAAREGAFVGIGFATGEPRATALLEEVRAAGGQGMILSLDFKHPGMLGTAVDNFIGAVGKIDGLVNSAGIHVAGPLTSLTIEEIRGQIDINLTGIIALTQAAVAQMVRRRTGSVVQIGSVSAHRVVRGHSVYSATKAGLEGFTRALAGEVARRSVRVNCVVPGPVLTPMLQKTIDETGDDPSARVPMGRLIKDSEVAEAVVFLLSDQSSAITGVMLPVDGGYLLG